MRIFYGMTSNCAEKTSNDRSSQGPFSARGTVYHGIIQIKLSAF